MIMYNVTINVDHEAHDEWLQWMKEHHIPDVLATGCFRDARIARIIAEEDGGKTYSIQYFAVSMADYDRYIANEADRLRYETELKFGGRIAAFRTLLHIIHDTNG